jgi:hypothetical protein
MYQSPNNFDFDPNDNLNQNNSTQDLVDGNDLDNLSKKHIVQRKKQLEKLFTYLIAFGVGLGAVIAIVVVIALNKFGLTTKPYETESQPQPTETLELEGVEQQ